MTHAAGKIAVTGGAGFIGTNLLHELRRRYKNYQIVSLDMRAPAYPVSGVSYKQCDARNATALSAELDGCKKVFHLAASIGTHESFESPSDVFTTNVNGSINVLEYARRHDIEVFLAGMPGIWNNPYSISKDAAVRLVHTYFETYRVRACALRWYSVYGPYQYLERYNKAVPTFIDAALKNQPLPIYGDGAQVADFIYASDATRLAIDMLEEQRWGEVVPCASGTGISTLDLAETIIRLCKSSSKVVHLPMRAGEPEHSRAVADTAHLHKLFPDYQLIDLEKGLRMTIDHYRQHPPAD